MNLGQLLELHECGALQVEEKSTTELAIIGGMALNNEQCKLFAENIGWSRYSLPAHVIINKTNKFMNGIKKGIKNNDIYTGTEVGFENTRRQNTEKHIDRIKLICPNKFDITVLYGMPGIGGVYGIYSSENYFKHPVHSCSTLRQVGNYINNLY